MARYLDVANDLRRRITEETEWAVGEFLPSIAALQEQYGVPGLNTIRQAQQLLVREGLLVTEQGRGARVVSLKVNPAPVDMLAELLEIRGRLDRLINACRDGGAIRDESVHP